jgi:hypothetical protein
MNFVCIFLLFGNKYNIKVFASYYIALCLCSAELFKSRSASFFHGTVDNGYVRELAAFLTFVVR